MKLIRLLTAIVALLECSSLSKAFTNIILKSSLKGECTNRAQRFANQELKPIIRFSEPSALYAVPEPNVESKNPFDAITKAGLAGILAITLAEAIFWVKNRKYS